MAKQKKDASKCLRLNMIVDLLNKRTPYGGVTVKELSSKYEVSERQIHRDLNTIQNELRVSLVRTEREVDGRKSVCYGLEAGYLPSMSPEKSTVLFLSLLQQKGSALTGHINELKDALVANLFKYHYDPHELAVEKLQERIHLVEEALAEPGRVGELFNKLVRALQDSHRVKIWYFAGYSGEVSDRVVEPYGLICKRQNWYLVARCLKRQDIRVFRVDQIKEAVPYVTEKFTYPEDFNLKGHMAQSWGVINAGEVCRVRLKFSPGVAFRVKNTIYHSSQSIEKELDDGSVVISYHVCGLKEMRTWIVQWGDAVEVLEPEELREQMCALAESIIKVYRGSTA